MIYILLANGPSVVPLFLPWIPQLLLLAWAISTLFYHGFQLKPLIVVILVGLMLIIAASIAENYLKESIRIINIIPNVVVGSLIAAGIQYRYGGRFAHIYSQAILIMSLVGILGLLIVGVIDFQLVSSIGERQYHTNLFTSWISDSGFNSSSTYFSPFLFRLQSMFDEPGTFGILLVPAFFYYVYAGKVLPSILLLLAVFLTESAIAWVLCSIILVLRVFVIRSFAKKCIYLAILIGIASLSLNNFIYLFQIKSGNAVAYENFNSLGVRLAEYTYLIESWSSHLVPMQNQHIIANYFPNGISSAYVKWYSVGGVVFVLVFLSTVTMFMVRIIKYWRSQDPTVWFSLVLSGTMIFSGFQRTSFLDNILFLTLILWALSYTINRPSVFAKEES